MFDDHVNYDPVHLELQIWTRTKRRFFSDPACAQTCSLRVIRTRWPLSCSQLYSGGVQSLKASTSSYRAHLPHVSKPLTPSAFSPQIFFRSQTLSSLSFCQPLFGSAVFFFLSCCWTLSQQLTLLLKHNLISTKCDMAGKQFTVFNSFPFV